MLAVNLVDNLDSSICYGILLCNNENVTESVIQNKIIEIKERFHLLGEDWIVEDIINSLPEEWRISFQIKHGKIEI